MVYFIEAVGANRVKIGKTRDLHATFMKLHRASPFPLSFLFALDGYTEEEHDFHRRFAPLRRAGEWFEKTGDLKKFIFKTCEAYHHYTVTRACDSCGCYAGNHLNTSGDVLRPDYSGFCDCGCSGGTYDDEVFDPDQADRYQEEYDDWYCVPCDCTKCRIAACRLQPADADRRS